MIQVSGRSVWGPYVSLDGVGLYLDAASARSYPGSGPAWLDLVSPTASFTLVSPVSQPTYLSFTQGYAAASGPSASTAITLPGPDLTAEALVRFDDNHSERHTIISNLSIGPTQATGWSFHLDRFDYDGMPARSLRFQFGPQGSYAWNAYSSPKNSVLFHENWHHVAVTATGLNSSSPTVRFYVNGEPLSASFSTAATKAPIASSTGPDVRVGASYLSATQSWTSSLSLSQVRVYSRALSDSEVSSNHQAFRSRFPDYRESVYVVGEFTQAGSIDESTYLRGIVQFSSSTGELVSKSAGFDFVQTSPQLGPIGYAVFSDLDGKIMVCGSFRSYAGVTAGCVVRLNKDLTVDPTFNTGSGFDRTVRRGAVDQQGKILLVGDFVSFNGTSASYIIRLNSDGSRDTTFDIGTGLNSQSNGCVIDNSGKVLVWGSFSSYNGTTASRLVRLTATGSVDPGFTYSNPGFNNDVFNLDEDSSGRLWVVGNFTTYGGFGTYNRIIALNPDSTVYATPNFGTGFNSTVNTIFIQSDGKLLISGNQSTYNGQNISRVLRLLNNGSLDTSFPNTAYNGSFRIDSIIQQPGVGIVLGGQALHFNNEPVGMIYRIDTSDTLDNTLSPPALNGHVYSMLETDGVITAVGAFSGYFKDPRISPGLVKIDLDGYIDDSLTTGKFEMPIGRTPLGDNATDVVQVGDRLAICGGFLRYAGVTSVGLVVITPTGSIAPGFNSGKGFQFGVGGRPFTMDVTTSGELYVGGQFTAYDDKPTPTFIRVDKFGNKLTPDIASFPGYGANNSVLQSKIDYKGRILVLGSAITAYGTYSVARLFRTNPDSLAIDPTFNMGTGLVGTVFSSRGIDIDRNNRIVVSGLISSWNGTPIFGICRINEDGTLDPSFSTGTGFSVPNRYPLGSLVQDDGKIVVWGWFSSYNGTTANSIIRLNSDGSVDSSFNSGLGFAGGWYTSAGQGPFSWVNSCSIDREGRITANGIFYYYDGTPVSSLARIMPDGSLDRTFSVGVNFTGQYGKVNIF